MSTTNAKEYAEERERASDRFFTHQAGRVITDEQKEAISKINALVVNLAVEIGIGVPNGRNKSIAFTALEDAQIRAIRGMFEHASPAEHASFIEPTSAE